MLYSLYCILWNFVTESGAMKEIIILALASKIQYVFLLLWLEGVIDLQVPIPPDKQILFGLM